MSARSDLVNSAASVLVPPGNAVESGAPPSDVGLMGAAMPAGTDTEASEKDVTRVAEGEPTTEPVEETKEPEVTTEPAKTEPGAPAKQKFDAKGYSSQHAALTRRMKAVEAAEAKVKELISIKESEFLTREQKIAALEKLDELDEMDLIKLAAERRGKSPNDILRTALWKQAGYQPEGDVKTEGEQKKAPLDPELIKLIKANEEEAKAARKEAEELKQYLIQREQAEAAREDADLVSNISEHALSLVSEERHQHLSLEEPENIVKQYLYVANEQAKLYNEGRISALPSPEDILDHLDELHKREYERRYNRLQERSKGATTAAVTQSAANPPATTPVSKSPEPLQKSSSGPKAITNAMTAQTGPGVKGKHRKERELIGDAGDYLKSKGF